MLLCDFCDVSELFVEGLIPATHMAVATHDIGERSLVEGLDGLAVAFFERDRHERFDSRGWAAVPCKTEYEPPVLFDLAIYAAKPVFAVLCGLDHHAVGTADAEIDLCFGAAEIRGPHPLLHVFRIGPQSKEQRGGRGERARDEECFGAQSSAHYASPCCGAWRYRRPSCRSFQSRSDDGAQANRQRS